MNLLFHIPMLPRLRHSRFSCFKVKGTAMNLVYVNVSRVRKNQETLKGLSREKFDNV